MISIVKRNGTKVEFDVQKIIIAITCAMRETEIGANLKEANVVASDVRDYLVEHGITEITVNGISDLIEEELMDVRPDVARRYIIYREARNHARSKKVKKTASIFTKEFISRYKHLPDPMSQLGSFVYYRTYSRWLPEEKRRERWWETVRRAVEYNCSLAPTSREEAEELFDNVYNLRQFLSGRTFWVGGTDVAKSYKLANFNCAYKSIDSVRAFKELFYLMMVGVGCGIGINKEYVSQMPKFRTDVELINKSYAYTKPENRQSVTSVEFEGNMAEITVGDSKEGWSRALEMYLEVLSHHDYRDIDTVIINYDFVRPKGARLKTFGGTASGHESLLNMFRKVDAVMQRKVSEGARVELEPIDCLDIATIIAENVVVGGVRRSAIIACMDDDDEKSIGAKDNLYKLEAGVWSINTDLSHRQMSNNSILFDKKPTRERLKWLLEKQRFSGEPGFINKEEALRRNPNMKGVNPCSEILLDSSQTCNLTTVNVMAFAKDGEFDLQGLLRAQELSAKAGYRMTMVELELNEWSRKQERDRLTGCSLTGWQDMVNALNVSMPEQAELLKLLRKSAHEAIEGYAKELGTPRSLLITAVKPEGTLSQLPTVSSGVHYSHSPYFLRRVRINSADPLVKVAEDLGWNIYPEVGQSMATCSTKVVEFPVKAPEGKTKYEASAIEQLENYKMFMTHYTDHTTSITVHVRKDEWIDVEEWLWENWDTVVGVSFLSLDDNYYELLPYEACTKEVYEEMVKTMKEFNPALISKYEKEEIDIDMGNESCDSGSCPIR